MPYERGGPYPGLFLFTQASRMMRPVRQVSSQQQELIGSLEQTNMHIRCANCQPCHSMYTGHDCSTWGKKQMMMRNFGLVSGGSP